jgi:putative endonuclease
MAFTLAQVVQSVNRLVGIWLNRNLRVGFVSEHLAKLYLNLHGFRTFKPHGKQRVQIDLLMRRGNLLVVAEVKYRPNLAKGLLAVGPEQAKRLNRAALQLAAHYPNVSLRTDVLIITPSWPFVHHFKGALDD